MGATGCGLTEPRMLLTAGTARASPTKTTAGRVVADSCPRKFTAIRRTTARLSEALCARLLGDVDACAYSEPLRGRSSRRATLALKTVAPTRALTTLRALSASPKQLRTTVQVVTKTAIMLAGQTAWT